MDLLTFAVPAMFSVLTLALSWVAFHQKIGQDESVAIRTDLRDCKAEVTRLTTKSDNCENALQAIENRYQAQVENLRNENLSLMRRALRLDGGQ